MNQTLTVATKFVACFHTLRLIIGCMVVQAGLPLSFAVAGNGHPLGIYPTGNSQDFTFYTPNLTYRRDPTTGQVAITATATYAGSHETANPSSCLDWDEGQHWAFVSDKLDDPNMEATLTVDLQRPFMIGRTYLRLSSNNVIPQRYEIRGSANGTDYSTLLVPETKITNGNLYDSFAAREVRYVRVVFKGSSPSDKLIMVPALQIFASVLGPPVTTRDGLTATDLVWAPATPLTNNWQRQENLWDHQPTSAWYAKGDATADAQLLINMQNVRALFGLELSFYGGNWQNGGKVELSTDNVGWTTVFNQQTPFGSTFLNFTDKPAKHLDAQYIRITNYHRDGTIGTGGLGSVVPYETTDAAAPEPLAAFKSPMEGTVSAAIYDTKGTQLKRLLLALPTHKGQLIQLYWDGCDLEGKSQAYGKYEWRAIFANVTGTEDTLVGNTGTPPYGLTTGNGSAGDIDCDREGNYYEISEWKESHLEFKKYNSHRVPQYGGGGTGYRIATDGQYVFFAHYNDNETETISRMEAATGKPLNFESGGNGINISTGTKEHGVGGLCVDDAGLWVSNIRQNRVELYNKKSGKQLATFPVVNPRGIASEGKGKIWVANRADRISLFSYSVPDYKFTEQPAKAIRNLKNPTFIRIGGPDQHLFAIERDLNRLREFDIRAVPVQAGVFGAFGTSYRPGPVADIMLHELAGIAVDTKGRVYLNDVGNRSVKHFNADGKLRHQDHQSWQPNIAVTKFNKSTHQVLNAGLEYEVDNQKQVHPDWMGDGTWRLKNNWCDAFISGVGCSVRRTLEVPGVGKVDYLFSLLGPKSIQGVAVYRIDRNEAGFHRCAALGCFWMGTNQEEPAREASWSWRDTDGNGQIQFTKIGEDNAELKWSPEFVRYATPWVDDSGNIWFGCSEIGNKKGGVIKVPLEGFDDKGNPKYDWEHRVEVADATPQGLIAKQLRVAPDGGFLINGGDSASVVCGSETIIYEADGEFVGRISLKSPMNVMGVDTDPVPGSGYFWTAFLSGLHLGMWTTDGLLVAHVGPPSKLDPTTRDDWFDNAMPIDVFHLPGTPTSERLVYCEHVYEADMFRWKIAGIGSEKRQQTTFAWPVGNIPPQVAVTSPKAASKAMAPAIITLQANASDSDGTIRKVEFYQGGNLIATITSKPYTYRWTEVGVGVYSITAKAFDNKGAVVSSEPVVLTVGDSQWPFIKNGLIKRDPSRPEWGTYFVGSGTESYYTTDGGHAMSAERAGDTGLQFTMPWVKGSEAWAVTLTKPGFNRVTKDRVAKSEYAVYGENGASRLLFMHKGIAVDAEGKKAGAYPGYVVNGVVGPDAIISLERVKKTVVAKFNGKVVCTWAQPEQQTEDPLVFNLLMGFYVESQPDPSNLILSNLRFYDPAKEAPPNGGGLK